MIVRILYQGLFSRIELLLSYHLLLKFRLFRGTRGQEGTLTVALLRCSRVYAWINDPLLYMLRQRFGEF